MNKERLEKIIRNAVKLSADEEKELKAIADSDGYKVMAKIERAKYRKKQVLYQKRWMKKHGDEFIEKGITLDAVDEIIRYVLDEEADGIEVDDDE